MLAVPLIVHQDPHDPGAAELYVDALVDGRRMRMLLDTGAASSRILADQYTRTFVRSDSEESPGRGVLGDAGRAARVIVPSLEIGGVKVESLSVELAETGPESVGAILGLDILGSHRLDVRMSEATIALDVESAVQARLPLVQSSRGHPHVDVEFSPGGVARAIWDTGAAATVVDRAFALAHPDLFKLHGTSQGIDSAGNTLDVPMVRMAECVVGGRRFAASLAAVVDILGIQRPGDPDFAMIVGYPLICQADWAIDLARGWWGFLR